MHRFAFVVTTFALTAVVSVDLAAQQTAFRLTLRSQQETAPDSQEFTRSVEEASWNASETAFIVCDVWDKHHCLNAVRRMEEFLPRMNQVLIEARGRGATIIHAPSDCMPAYADHPARQRATEAPASQRPEDIEFWCSKISAEERAVYPIDQSDGGVDDDPQEHERWAAELKALGRNPALPWQAQSPQITIDAARDYISDRGDEVWNILESRGIRNVVLLGVHTNMCVLGRPFGLRQMVRGGKNVVLMRDMTDCMYNPSSWPYVDHFTGNDLIISHVERYVCPTVTSDQVLGGTPFVSRYDRRAERDVMTLRPPTATKDSLGQHWTTAAMGSAWSIASDGVIKRQKGVAWYRCTVRLPSPWIEDGELELKQDAACADTSAWLNGVPFQQAADGRLRIATEAVAADDIHLLVVRVASAQPQEHLPRGWSLGSGRRHLNLDGRWQFRLGDDPAWSNVPLPAKFALGSDVLFEAR